MDFQNNPQSQTQDQLPDQTGTDPAGNAPDNTRSSMPGSFQNNLQNSINGYSQDGFSANGSFRNGPQNGVNGNFQNNPKSGMNGYFQSSPQNGMNGYFQNSPHNGFPKGQYPADMPIYVRSTGQFDNTMATAAMITGILSALSLIFILLFPILPFILGGVSIVLAMLSRGSGKQFSSHAKTGLATSICSISAVFLLTVVVCICLFTSETFMEEFNQTYEEYYGESFDDFYEFYY